MPKFKRKEPYQKTLKPDSRTREYRIRNFKLISARLEKGLRGKNISEQIGVSISSYYSYESLRVDPKEEVKEKISEILGKKKDYLFPPGIEYCREYHQDVKREKKDIFYLGKRIENFDFDNLPSREDNPEKLSEKRELREVIEKMLDSFGYCKAEIIKLRFGLEDSVSFSLVEVSRVFGVSKERVRQLRNQALNKLKHPSRKKILRDYLDLF